MNDRDESGCQEDDHLPAGHWFAVEIVDTTWIELGASKLQGSTAEGYWKERRLLGRMHLDMHCTDRIGAA